MFYANNVQDTRQLFFTAWQKQRRRQALLPLEQQIVEVMLDHPEYHAVFDAGSPEQASAFFAALGQTNPFLHMGLHLTIRDQIATNRPAGIRHIYTQLIKKHADKQMAEHLLMEPLADALWQAQRDQTMPDEQTYLDACHQLMKQTDEWPDEH
ncbi:MAG TPA: DUF1841 domain-containing protein [Legionella sp.]|nr:DUF1841 domain-containing protein [Legionella sp.]